MPDPIAEDLGFELLPEEDELTPDEDVAAAVASALAPDFPAIPGAPRTPLGRSWAFDWERGRFIRRGRSPAEVRGVEALKQWILMTVHSAQFAHAVFSDDFGVERAEEPMGEPAEAGDLARRITRALLRHDRITAVENVIVGDPVLGEVRWKKLDVILDDESRETIENGVPFA